MRRRWRKKQKKMHVNIWRAKVSGEKDWKKICHIQPHDLLLHANIWSCFCNYIWILDIFLVLFTTRLQLVPTSSSNWVIPHHIFILIYVLDIYHICIIYTPYMMLHLHHILVYDNVYTHITKTTKIWLQLWPKEQWYFFYLHPSWLDVCRHKFVDNLIVPFFEWK